MVRLLTVERTALLLYSNRWRYSSALQSHVQYHGQRTRCIKTYKRRKFSSECFACCNVYFCTTRFFEWYYSQIHEGVPNSKFTYAGQHRGKMTESFVGKVNEGRWNRCPPIRDKLLLCPTASNLWGRSPLLDSESQHYFRRQIGRSAKLNTEIRQVTRLRKNTAFLSAP